MPAYSGKFQYLDAAGATASQGPCQFRFDKETAVVTPASGTAIAFDLGDVDLIVKHDWDLELALFTGRRLQLRQFGAPFSTMFEGLLAAWRDRTVRCLLLEDLEEIARYSGTAALPGPAVPAEIRLYKSNLAVLPLDGPAIQWRLAGVDAVSFDEAAYAITVESAGERLVLAKLGKRTDEFRGNLEGAISDLRTHEAEALHAAFPFLDPDRLQQLNQTMPEGRSVTLEALRAIHPKLPDALIARAVDEHLRPYFDALRKRMEGDGLMTGFKFIRPDEEGTEDAGDSPPDAAVEAPETPDDRQTLFFWFFFPLPGGLVAWEATTGSGRATYFFDAPPPLEQSVARLTSGLALVNFRREPVYLPDESLDQQQRFHRYAIGCRKLPDLRTLRAAFRGRALHTSPEAWMAQVEAQKG
ncbi:MAG TPA: hypothetical protein VHW09_06320 [Bryobacteraceae bacterium]|jgi:hypothetical protein|nr:hypothetical protein [Bryobacteraceae bacterium]